MEIRPAATVIVCRSAGDASRGVEVLALKRSPETRFLPGYVVFPGGAVDAADAGLAREWFGTDEEAARACALRELEEEAGLVATAEGIVASSGEEVRTAPPSHEQMPEIARWIAPEFMPVRFDARFFALAAGHDVRPRADGVEVVGAWWAQPADLLDDFAEGRAELLWPTLKMLEALAPCRAVEDVLSLRVEQVPHPMERR